MNSSTLYGTHQQASIRYNAQRKQSTTRRAILVEPG